MASLYVGLGRLAFANEHVERAQVLMERQQKVIQSFQRIGDVFMTAEARKVYESMERALEQYVQHQDEIAARISDLQAAQVPNTDAAASAATARQAPRRFV